MFGTHTFGWQFRFLILLEAEIPNAQADDRNSGKSHDLQQIAEGVIGVFLYLLHVFA
jgi:hypothetical protein